jgi:hypothetical protein
MFFSSKKKNKTVWELIQCDSITLTGLKATWMTDKNVVWSKINI